MTRMTLTRCSLFIFLAGFSVGTAADVLLIQQVRQAGTMELPANGASMSEVEARFGTPAEKQAAVGDPPITRWVFDRWSVYFEYDRALYTVLHEGEVIDRAGTAGDDGETEPGEAEEETEPGSESD